MKINGIFKKRIVWAIAIYKLKYENDIFNLDKHMPIYFLGERGIRRNSKYQAFVADPFLFVHDEKLYLFYEIKTDFGVGEIWAQSMNSQGAWTSHGQVLKEDFHLSYPQVFSHDSQIWMIPEAACSEKVWLYGTDSFPHGWKRVKVLIDEPLVDPSIIIKPEGIYLFGTTRANELKLFFSPDLIKEFVSTGFVITSDRAISRNGGRPICIQNCLYRVAQNCKNSYGKNISLLKIDKLSFDKYSEHLFISELYKKNQDGCLMDITILVVHHLGMSIF